jgi:hypothetical protein
MTALFKQFDQAMLTIYRRAIAEAKCTASIFFRMLDEKGRTKYLINSESPSEGYTRLYELGRLDLTVEAVVVEGPRWRTTCSLRTNSPRRANASRITGTRQSKLAIRLIYSEAPVSCPNHLGVHYVAVADG